MKVLSIRSGKTEMAQALFVVDGIGAKSSTQTLNYVGVGMKCRHNLEIVKGAADFAVKSGLVNLRIGGATVVDKAIAATDQRPPVNTLQVATGGCKNQVAHQIVGFFLLRRIAPATQPLG
jgi:hypothetical protein